MSTERQAATDLDRLIPRDDDPPAETGRVLLYSRVVDETLRVLARYPDGSIQIIL